MMTATSGAFALVIAIGSIVTTSPAAARARCLGAPATIVGTSGDDVIEGTDGRDVIVAGAGKDSIDARAGRDLICGGAGADSVRADDGDDVVAAGRGNDFVDGGLGDDVLIGAKGEDTITDGRTGDSDTMIGGSGNDRLEDGHYMFGGPGNDALFGRDEASDVIVGGPDADSIDGGIGGSDVASFEFAGGGVQVDLEPPEGSPGLEVVGADGLDNLTDIEDVRGSPFDDEIQGSAGPNHLLGGGGSDTLHGKAGDDRLTPGPGDDSLFGGEGFDQADYTESAAAVTADIKGGGATGEGNDALAEIENLRGTVFDDALSGDDGPNFLDGFHGDDRLFGRAGDDFLAFGDGDAGAGEDECLNSAADNCERFVVADPGPGAWIERPDVGADRAASTQESIAGGAAGGLGALPERFVYVSLRSISPAGCLWYRAGNEALERGSCGEHLWNRVGLVGDESGGTWEMRLGRFLPPGEYRACAAVRLNDQIFCGESFFGPNPVPFTLR